MKAPLLSLLLLCLLLLHTQVLAASDAVSSQTLALTPAEDTPRQAALLKRSLRTAFEEQLALLQESEAKIEQQIEELKRRRNEISQKKRSHYMCLVNLVTCYRKRK